MTDRPHKPPPDDPPPPDDLAERRQRAEARDLVTAIRDLCGFDVVALVVGRRFAGREDRPMLITPAFTINVDDDVVRELPTVADALATAATLLPNQNYRPRPPPNEAIASVTTNTDGDPPRIWRAGDRVAVVPRGGRAVPGRVQVAAPNGRALVIEFAPLLGALTRPSLSLDWTRDGFVDLFDRDKFYDVEPEGAPS